MAQQPQIIDLNRSYMPVDPNAFPSNLISTEREDGEEKTAPVIIYEGYNFLPTSYGYRSYFGANSKLDMEALPARCDKAFIYQLANHRNVIIALCEDGLYYSNSTTLVGAVWVKGLALALPAVGTYREWTHCVIENTLYVYRQAEPSYWKITSLGFTESGSPSVLSLTITAVVPTFLNMAGQLGIFRANASLGFWDSANSIGWSSPLNLQDFTPSLTTLAGNAIFTGILGRIVTIRSQGDNFVIYTTRGIVGVRYISTSTVLWEATTITDTAGIATSHSVTAGITELEHFAYTNTGIKKVGAYNALNKAHAFEEILTELYDLLREKNPIVAVDMLNSRYLIFSVLDPDYINGKTSFEFDTISPHLVQIKVDDVYWNAEGVPPHVSPDVDLSGSIQKQILAGQTDGMFLEWRGSGVGSFGNLTTPMHEYVIDSRGNYIPNKKDHTGPCFTAVGDADTAPLASYVALCTPTFPDQWDNLGYVGYKSIMAGEAQLGLMDAGLSSFKAAQIKEWDNFLLIQEANKAQFLSIPNSPAVVVQGPQTIGGAMEAQEIIDKQINALIVSKGGTRSGNTVTYLDTDYGSYLTGKGTMQPEVFTGVGNHGASYSLRMDFVGGYRVRRMRRKTFSIRQAATPTLLWYAGVGVTGAQDAKYFRATQAKCLAACEAWIPPAVLPDSSPYYDASLIARFVYTAQGWPGINGHYYQYYKIATGLPYNPPFFYTRYPTEFSGNTASWTGQDNTYLCAIDTSEYAYVEVIDNPTLSGSSTLTAVQTDLTWANIPLPSTGVPEALPTGGYVIPAIDASSGLFPGGVFDYTYPGATYLLQDGSVAPIYPTYVGAFVLDVALKKMGKLKESYRAFLDYSVINEISEVTPYSNLGVDGAFLKADGYVYHMDAKPSDSFMRYGKIGFFRKGFTGIQEVKAVFRSASTGDITIDTSIYGVNLEPTLKQLTSFTGVLAVNCTGGFSGRWHTIKISGNYDLQYLEFRGTIGGRR